jgi:hypothetical protein
MSANHKLKLNFRKSRNATRGPKNLQDKNKPMLGVSSFARPCFAKELCRARANSKFWEMPYGDAVIKPV